MTQQGWERAQGLSAEHQASSPGPATSAETDSQAVQAVQELAPCSSLACEQQLGEMPCNLLKAEQLSDALQQQCRILAAETRQLQQRENTAKLWTAQLQVNAAFTVALPVTLAGMFMLSQQDAHRVS